MPASNCQTPPPGPVLRTCRECMGDLASEDGHGWRCSYTVSTATRIEIDAKNNPTGFDGTYENARTTADLTDTRQTAKTHGEGG